MNLDTFAIQLADTQARSFATINRDFQGGWSRSPAGVSLPFWPLMLAIVLILGLLLAFHDVVSGAAQQGELRRQANAVFAEAAWRCNAARAMSVRDNCLRQLQSSSGDDTALLARGVSGALPLK